MAVDGLCLVGKLNLTGGENCRGKKAPESSQFSLESFTIFIPQSNDKKLPSHFFMEVALITPEFRRENSTTKHGAKMKNFHYEISIGFVSSQPSCEAQVLVNFILNKKHALKNFVNRIFNATKRWKCFFVGNNVGVDWENPKG